MFGKKEFIKEILYKNQEGSASIMSETTSPTMKIMPNNLLREYEQYASEFEDAAIQSLRSGWYILGERLRTFEDQFAQYCGSKYAIGLASGLDALWIALRILGIGRGDEVIVQANTYIASVMGITKNGATPIFVEPDRYYGIDVNNIEEKITPRTKAVLAVHLYGMPCEMDKVADICTRHNLYLVEDCAQSHGAAYKGIMTGLWGSVGCFSFYPTKNLGAFGDGGAVITNDSDLDKSFRIFRNYGSQEHYKNIVVGANSRLDEIQAALLSVKLRHLDSIIEERIGIAKRYDNGIKNSKFTLPEVRPESTCVYHQYVIRTKDLQMRTALIEYLQARGIGTIIHYPIPPHLSEAYSYLGYKAGDFPITEYYADTVLSIPMYNGYTKEEQEYTIKALNEF